MSNMLIDCSNCCTPLQLPRGARSIRCTLCQAVTHVIPPPSSSAYYYNSSNCHGAAPPPSAPPLCAPHAGAVPWAPRPPRKKAVVCGISYRNTPNELKGCINDANCMRYLLVHRLGFPESSVLMLTDAEEESDPDKIPTKLNIMNALRWLVQGCQAGDSLVFHFSGHGSQQTDTDGDEVDGFDETLCPLDHESEGMIVDDEINETIVRPLPRGVKLHAIVDACHSGTVLDLPFLCRMERSGHYVWEDHQPRNGIWKGTNGGEVISFSGCDDHQTSSDTLALSKVASTGAMTYCFIRAIEQGQAETYGSILNSMRDTIRNNTDRLRGNKGPLTTLLTMLMANALDGQRQEPQLTSNQIFDVYMKPFSL